MRGYLERFLYIHPYSNGNGRAARLLVGFLLWPLTRVPIDLTPFSDPNIYIDCLRQAHLAYDNTSQRRASVLATYLLERVYFTLERFLIFVIRE